MFCILVQKSEEIEESRALDNSDECNGECQYATFKIIFALVSSSEIRTFKSRVCECQHTNLKLHVYCGSSVLPIRRFCFLSTQKSEELRMSTRINLKLYCS